MRIEDIKFLTIDIYISYGS